MGRCAFDCGNNVCKCLETKNCVGCHFRKTKEQLEASRKAAMERLLSLPNAQQLVEKYHKRKLDAELSEIYGAE